MSDEPEDAQPPARPALPVCAVTGKRGYPDFRSAAKDARAVVRRGDRDRGSHLDCYRCRHCANYHLGRSLGNADRRQRERRRQRKRVVEEEDMKARCPYCDSGCDQCKDGLREVRLATPDEGHYHSMICNQCGGHSGGRLHGKDFPLPERPDQHALCPNCRSHDLRFSPCPEEA